MEQIIFITGNLGKLQEVQRYLGVTLEHISLDLSEIQSLDLQEIVRDKTSRAYDKVRQPVLVEDVSFVFHALGKLPGPLIKWFEKELKNEGLCRLLDGKDRSCTATVCYGYHDGKEIHIFDGSMHGSVADHELGTNSFGWAPIFIPDGYNRTYAELSSEEQSKVAMRRIALKKLHDFLKTARYV